MFLGLAVLGFGMVLVLAGVQGHSVRGLLTGTYAPAANRPVSK